MGQAGSLHSSVGAGLEWDSPAGAWNVALDYAYGAGAIRSGGRGSHSAAVRFQYDFAAGPGALNPRAKVPSRSGREAGLEWQRH